MDIRTAADMQLIRVGATAGVVGSLGAMVGNLLHPVTPIDDPEGVARTIAQSDIWTPVHVAIVLSLILMLGGLVAITRRLEGGAGAAFARLGAIAAIAGVTVGIILVIVDGVAAKQLADVWAAAPPDETGAALRVVLGEESINFALASLFNILFAGVTFILYGVAVARSGEFAPWVGWLVLAAGAGSIFVGLVQADVGESTRFTQLATIPFPTIITVWVAGMDLRLLRRR